MYVTVLHSVWLILVDGVGHTLSHQMLNGVRYVLRSANLSYLSNTLRCLFALGSKIYGARVVWLFKNVERRLNTHSFVRLFGSVPDSFFLLVDLPL